MMRSCSEVKIHYQQENEKGTEESMQTGNIGPKGICNEDGRIIGRFSCRNVVNLSRRNLSEDTPLKELEVFIRDVKGLFI